MRSDQQQLKIEEWAKLKINVEGNTGIGKKRDTSWVPENGQLVEALRKEAAGRTLLWIQNWERAQPPPNKAAKVNRTNAETT